MSIVLWPGMTHPVPMLFKMHVVGEGPGAALSVLRAFFYLIQISSVQLLSHVRLFATPWTAARQAPCPSD